MEKDREEKSSNKPFENNWARLRENQWVVFVKILALAYGKLPEK